MIGAVIALVAAQQTNTLNDTLNLVEKVEIEQCQQHPEDCKKIADDNLELVKQLDRLFPAKKEPSNGKS